MRLFSSSPMYLVDMATYRPPDELRVMINEEVRVTGRHWKVSIVIASPLWSSTPDALILGVGPYY